jgi:hypothetical protein
MSEYSRANVAKLYKVSSLFKAKSIKITVIKRISNGLPAPLYQFNFIMRILINATFN